MTKILVFNARLKVPGNIIQCLLFIGNNVAHISLVAKISYTRRLTSRPIALVKWKWGLNKLLEP